MADPVQPPAGVPGAATPAPCPEGGDAPHVPVLLAETVAFLQPRPGGRYVDGTVGAGGHARALLEAAGGMAELLAVDRDPAALELAAARLAPFRERVRFVHGDYRELDRYLDDMGWDRVDGILLDLGVSSMQLDDPARGFSYQAEGPLDMRMDPGQPVTAADLVNSASRDQLAEWIRRYGEERWAARIADFIVAQRRRRPITTTSQLVEVIKAAIPARARRRGPHPARRTFQALRIVVNRELEGLDQALRRAAARLAPGGRLVVISFHSLEDRTVKQVFRQLAASPRPGDPAGAGQGEGRGPGSGAGPVAVPGPAGPGEAPAASRQGADAATAGGPGGEAAPAAGAGPGAEPGPAYRLLTRRPVTPGEEEARRNPRARSARLRALERTT